jgi:hypothetical protein
MDGGIRDTALLDVLDDGGRGLLKAVAHPDGQVVGGRGRRHAVVGRHLALDAGRTVQDVDPGECRRNGLGEQLPAVGGELGLVVQERSAAAAELGFPGGALGGLEVVFALDLHQDTVVHQGLDQAGHRGAQRGGGVAQVVGQEIRQVLWGSAHPAQGSGRPAPFLPGAGSPGSQPLVRQLVDEVHQGADAAADHPVRAAFLFLDDLLEALLQLARDDQLIGLLVVDEVDRDDGADRLVCHQAARLVGDAQLGAHLGGGATGVATVQDQFPETAPHGQQGVVRDIRRPRRPPGRRCAWISVVG